ncbi:MAG: hypothetical protein GY869_07480 [Planctomycetes bacterium]|nr:hypothetical protein [Planctomycetota bacterium]
MESINAVLSQVFTWLNVVFNALGKVCLAPVGAVPGWLSNTIISAVMGVLLLLLFKYTSNQKAIGRVRDKIKANMLALKLFKDDLRVTFQSQGRLFAGAFTLLFHSIKPLAVMIVPVVLILAQMAAWYQFRPLNTDEKTLIIMKLNGEENAPLPTVSLDLPPGAEVVNWIPISSLHEVRWEVRAHQEGKYTLVFDVAGEKFEKDFVVGSDLKRVSPLRPGQNWGDIILFPLETPFAQDSSVQSISIDYPPRNSKIYGADWWMGYFFVVSIIFALIFKPIFKVKI